MAGRVEGKNNGRGRSGEVFSKGGICLDGPKQGTKGGNEEEGGKLAGRVERKINGRNQAGRAESRKKGGRWPDRPYLTGMVESRKKLGSCLEGRMQAKRTRKLARSGEPVSKGGCEGEPGEVIGKQRVGRMRESWAEVGNAPAGKAYRPAWAGLGQTRQSLPLINKLSLACTKVVAWAEGRPGLAFPEHCGRPIRDLMSFYISQFQVRST
jgi:hypothetical protein